MTDVPQGRCPRCGYARAVGACAGCGSGPEPWTARSRGSTVGGLFFGAGHVWRGARLLASRPRLWPILAAPICVNIVILVGGMLAYWYLGIPRLHAWALTEQAGWLTRLGLDLAAFVGVALACMVLFLLVGAFFNDVLSLAVERQHLGFKDLAPEGGWAQRAGVVLEMAKIVGFGLLVQVVAYGCGAVFLLVPVVNFVVVALWFALDGFLLALALSDFSLGRRSYAFGPWLGFLRRHAAPLGGFGMAMLALTMVPLLGLLIFPVGVAGASLLYLHLDPK